MELKIRTYLLFLLGLCCFPLSNSFGQNKDSYHLPLGVAYEKNVVIVKFSETGTSTTKTAQTSETLTVNGISSRFSMNSIEKIVTSQSSNKNKAGRSVVEESQFIKNIFRVTLEEGEDLEVAINKFLSFENVIYAEPLFLEKPLIVPNDPNVGFQDHLSVIKAFNAWDITTGDPSIIIGIVDTGIQLDNSDLVDNIHTNGKDPINGLDDDNNGYIDDFQGWDFADNDNDPTADFNGHGTHVAGVSSATTNNNLGISGVGYQSKMVPLKIFQSSNGFSNNSYQSIIYAADQGYDVINLSWGSVGTYSQFNQDIINYAVLERDVVVIAAAGNTDAELEFYPASYDHVVSVGASDVNDRKASFGTYSYEIDLVAPGAAVYSTRNGNVFSAEAGSSFSAPQVAGAAALVRAVFPELNALQVGEQLRVTTDDIYGVGNNHEFEGQLGTGRLNVFRAVSELNKKSLRLGDFEYQDAFGNFAFFDDTVSFTFDFVNYLQPLDAGAISITSESPYVTVLGDGIMIGKMDELSEVKDISTQIYLSENTPASERIILKLNYEDDTYNDYEYLEFTTNPDFLEINTPRLGTTISSEGNLGYADDSLRNGSGLVFDGKTIAKHLGIIVSNHQDSVSDNIINSYDGFGQEMDFSKIDEIKYYNNTPADLYSRSQFNDSNAGRMALGLLIEQEAMAWNDTDNQNFLLSEYRVTNDTELRKEGVKLGAFVDWDLEDASTNRVAWDETNQMGYVYDVLSEKIYAGLAILTEQEINFHALDVAGHNGNVAEINTEFTDFDKFNYLTSEKLSAGIEGNGNDVASLLSTEIGVLEPYESKKVAFAYIVGESLKDLQVSLGNARKNYEAFLLSPPIIHNQLVCIDEKYNLTIPGGSSFELYTDVGGTSLLFSGNDFQMNALSSDTVFYARNIDSLYTSDITRVEVTVKDPLPGFSMDLDTLLLGDNPRNEIQFTDNSGDAIAWFWEFSNGLTSSLQNPVVSFNVAGVYTVTLSITSEMGCVKSITQQVVIADRSAEPIINNQVVCQGATTTITASNSSNLNLYLTESLEELIFSNASLTVGPIDRDTVFYISSSEKFFESKAVPVVITIDPIESKFTFGADTLDLSSDKIIRLSGESTNATQYSWSVDGNSVSMVQHTTFEFTDQAELVVDLESTSELGCMDNERKIVSLSESSIPTVNDISVCKFTKAILEPGNGQLFYYYADGALQNLVHKGKVFVTENLDRDTLFFVTGADELKRSEAAEVRVEIIPFEVDLVADPDTLILENGRNVTFSSSSMDIISWNWSVEGRDYEEIFATPTFSFDTTGVYHVRLIAKNSSQCIDTTILNYVVMDPITSTGSWFNDKIDIFPNPAADYLTVRIEGQVPFTSLGVFDIMGKEILGIDISKLDMEQVIDISKIPNGLYLIKNIGPSVVYTAKVIVDK